MKRSDSALKIALSGKLAIMLAGFFWLLSSLSTLVSAPAGAETDSSVTKPELAQSIEITAREAPLDVFIQALFANTEIDVEINDSVEGVVSGKYEGSISNVLNKLSSEFGFVSQSEDGVVKVFYQSEKPKPSTQSKNQSIVALAEHAVSDSQKVPGNSLGKKQPTQINRVNATNVDRVVERVFVLKNAIAVDTRPLNASYPMIPGVVTQLKQLVKKLGVSSFTYVDAPIPRTIEPADSVVALPSMNAIIVKDLASRMALYEDLIHSLDITSNASSEIAVGRTARKNSNKWSVVR